MKRLYIDLGVALAVALMLSVLAPGQSNQAASRTATVMGTVTDVNGDLATAPEKINSDAHKAWMVKITLKNPNEVKDLLSASDYEKYIAEES